MSVLTGLTHSRKQLNTSTCRPQSRITSAKLSYLHGTSSHAWWQVSRGISTYLLRSQNEAAKCRPPRTAGWPGGAGVGECVVRYCAMRSTTGRKCPPGLHAEDMRERLGLGRPPLMWAPWPFIVVIVSASTSFFLSPETNSGCCSTSCANSRISSSVTGGAGKSRPGTSVGTYATFTPSLAHRHT